MNDIKLYETLDLLRVVLKDGISASNVINESVDNSSDHLYYKWSTKVETYLQELFYNPKFINDFKDCKVVDFDGNREEYINVQNTFSSQIGYVESLGQLLKHGYIRDQGIGIDSKLSKEVFVAMSFAEDHKDIFSFGIKPAIEENNYVAIRVDEVDHNDKIDDVILTKIKESRFLVVDYTGHRGGVYFEAGFGKGLGLQVIPLCKNSDKDLLHFDVRMYNTIFYTDITDLKEKLIERIEKTMGIYRDPVVVQYSRNEEEFPF